MTDLPTIADPIHVLTGDCLDVLRDLPAGCVDAVVTDPPYGLSFMGKSWDHGVPGPEVWAAVLAALRPGGYMVAMGGTRTYHRLACAIEDAGFEVRDCLSWLYGSGFPKGKGCLKPAWEPILLARRPGPRVLPLGVDECRVETGPRPLRVKTEDKGNETHTVYAGVRGSAWARGETTTGRWPANVAHDGSDEVMEAFAAFGEKAPGRRGVGKGASKHAYGDGLNSPRSEPMYSDRGTAARFFYCAKASRTERGPGNDHPTVKPLALMRWLVRLVCPAGGLVLDPFAGSGTTGVACLAEGRRAVLIEREPQYAEIARRRTALPLGPLAPAP